MYGDEMEWLEFRAQCLESEKNRRENLLKIFMNETGYKGILGYAVDLGAKRVDIYTNRPGYIIGKGGQDIKKLESLFSDEYGGDWHTTITEIRGGFVSSED